MTKSNNLSTKALALAAALNDIEDIKFIGAPVILIGDERDAEGRFISGYAVQPGDVADTTGIFTEKFIVKELSM